MESFEAKFNINIPRKKMKAQRYFFSGVAATVLLTLGATNQAVAQSAPSNVELGKRVDSIEMKLDALIEMMAKDRASAPVPSVASSPAESSTEQSEISSVDGYQNGLTLDLYLVPAVEDIATVIPPPPDLFPSASEHVEHQGRFEWGAFVNMETMKRFAEPMDQRIALLWSGFLSVPASGQQLFALEILIEKASRTVDCVANLVIDGKTVTQVITRRNGDGGKVSSSQGSLNLEQGKHKFALWGHCNGNRARFDRVHFNLLNKSPTDRAPQLIAPERFLTEG